MKTSLMLAVMSGIVLATSPLHADERRIDRFGSSDGIGVIKPNKGEIRPFSKSAPDCFGTHEWLKAPLTVYDEPSAESTILGELELRETYEDRTCHFDSEITALSKAEREANPKMYFSNYSSFVFTPETTGKPEPVQSRQMRRQADMLSVFEMKDGWYDIGHGWVSLDKEMTGYFRKAKPEYQSWAEFYAEQLPELPVSATQAREGTAYMGSGDLYDAPGDEGKPIAQLHWGYGIDHLLYPMERQGEWVLVLVKERLSGVEKQPASLDGKQGWVRYVDIDGKPLLERAR